LDDNNEYLGFTAIGLDLTEIDKLRDELVKKEKISAIGQMATNLAHDIKNPLSTITISTAIISRNSNDEITKRESYRIGIALDRIDHQVNEVLQFVKMPIISLGKSSILKILRDTIDNVEIPEKIGIILPKKDFDVVCDSEKMIIFFSNANIADEDRIFSALFSTLTKFFPIKTDPPDYLEKSLKML